MKFKDSIIIILLFIIAVTLGIFVGFKISEKNKNGNEIDQGNISDNKNDKNNNEQDYSLTEATRLMDNYVLEHCGSKYITDLTNETSKNYLSFKMTASTDTVACKELEDEGIVENENVMGGYGDVVLAQCELDEKEHYFEHNLYNYDNALKSKKVLFGNLSSLQKKVVYFDTDKYYYYYYYSTKNGFVHLNLPTGYGCTETFSYGLISARIIGDDLKILAYNTRIESITGIEIKETVNYEFTFKMQDTGYYLASIEEVK